MAPSLCNNPRFLLVYFTVINALIYFDRGTIAASLKNIEEEYDVSNATAGLLASVFILGYISASPVLAQMSRYWMPMKVVFCGLAVWVVAVIITSMSTSFMMFMISRSITGVGEAGFIALAPSLISDLAPVKRRTLWLSVFFSAMPVGAACGYICTGIFLQSGLTWRAAFMFEALLMIIPLITTCFVDLQRDGDAVGEVRYLLRQRHYY